MLIGFSFQSFKELSAFGAMHFTDSDEGEKERKAGQEGNALQANIT